MMDAYTALVPVQMFIVSKDLIIAFQDVAANVEPVDSDRGCTRNE